MKNHETGLFGTTLATNDASAPENDSSSDRKSLIENFRQARGLEGIYRCANTDGLAKLFRDDIQILDAAERLVLHDAGLIIDLRSPSERNEEDALHWMERAPGGPVCVRYGQEQNDKNGNGRCVLRLDILRNTRLFEYMDRNWFSRQQKVISGLYKAVDIDKLHNMRMDVLNEKGLLGLYEVLIDIGQSDFLTALKEITIYLEKEAKEDRAGNVVIHCVQGKDRTGLLVALCQSIMGVPRDDIVADYHLSHMMRHGAWARTSSREPGKLDRQLFSGAPKHLMQSTLDLIEEQHGSVSPGYMNAIGFTQEWQDRFKNAVEQRSTRRIATTEEVTPQSKM